MSLLNSLLMPLKWDLKMISLGKTKTHGQILVLLVNSNLLLNLKILKPTKLFNFWILIINLLMLQLNIKKMKPMLMVNSESWLIIHKMDLKNTLLTKLYSNSQVNMLLMEKHMLEKCKFGIQLIIIPEKLLFHSLLMKVNTKTTFSLTLLQECGMLKKLIVFLKSVLI